MSTSKNTLLVATRKGLLIFNRGANGWEFRKDEFLGARVSYACADPRNGRLWACLDHGHWGNKLHFSDDQGDSWTEIPTPVYPDGEKLKDDKEAKLDYLWCLQPGHVSRPDDLYFGTIPGGLFLSKDNGKSFELNRGLWDHPSRIEQWFGGGFDQPGIHSVIVDPKDADHIYVGISVAGVFESKDGGKTWAPCNKGLNAEFLPDPKSEIGQDPHIVVAYPEDCKYMWQQNHCGIYRTTDGGANWQDVSNREIGAYFGFAIAVDPKDAETAWVVPAVSDQTRVAVNGQLASYRTRDGGKNWEIQTGGLPTQNCYDFIYRHSLDITEDSLAMGTVGGSLFVSQNGGSHWDSLGYHFPMIYSVRFA